MRRLTFHEASILSLMAQAHSSRHLSSSPDADRLLATLPEDLLPLGEFLLHRRSELPDAGLMAAAQVLIAS